MLKILREVRYLLYVNSKNRCLNRQEPLIGIAIYYFLANLHICRYDHFLDTSQNILGLKIQELELNN